MNGYLLGYVALSLPVTASWYGRRLGQLGLRTGRLLSRLKNRMATAVRRRLRRFLSEDGDGNDTDAE